MTRNIDPVVGTWASISLSRILATYAIFQGATVLIYGPDRWSTSPALVPALAVPGKTATWGATLFVAGVCALYGSLTRHLGWTVAGHSLAAIWSMFFAVSMSRFLLPGAHAPTSGFFIYGVEGIVFVTLAMAAWRSR